MVDRFLVLPGHSWLISALGGVLDSRSGTYRSISMSIYPGLEPLTTVILLLDSIYNVGMYIIWALAAVLASFPALFVKYLCMRAKLRVALQEHLTMFHD